MLDGKIIQSQKRYFDNKSSQPAAVANGRQQKVKVGRRRCKVRAETIDAKVPGVATPFQGKLKE